MIDLLESQWWPYEKLVEFQNKRLTEIPNYAYNTIPAYRKKFDDANVKPADIKTKTDLYKLPITTREEMQNNSDFLNTQLIHTTLLTGGSTGVSLQYYDSKESEFIRSAAHLRGWSWNGYTPGKRLAVVASTQGIMRGKNILNLIGDLTTENLEKNVAELIKFKPQHLRGYVSSLYLLAKYCLDNNLKIEGIESINSISENLYDFQREIIEAAFDCRVFEEYCCNDGGACAWECESHNGLHYFMERAVIEEIDGEMIVTDLWNKAMPFIRYRNGDAVTFLEQHCSCNRHLPLISVKGRTNDILITKKGPLGPMVLMHHGIYNYPESGPDKGKRTLRTGIRAVQYIQKPDYLLQIRIVKNPWCTDDEILAFEKDIKSVAHDMSLQILFVDEIPTTARGKRNFIINEDVNLLRQWGF